MSFPPSRIAEERPPWAANVAALSVVVGAVLVGARSLAGEGSQAVYPYVWRDVAAVQLVCAVPLGWLVAGFVSRRASSASSIGLAVVLLGLSASPLVDAIRDGLTLVPGVVLRPTVALALATAAALGAAVLRRNWPVPTRAERGGAATALAGLAAAILILPPATYVAARFQHDSDRLGELVQQSRFGDARPLVRGLLALDPAGEYDGRPLASVAADVDRVVAELRSRVAVPLRPEATTGERLERARLLAMLGRNEEAVRVLKPLRASPAAPEADNLLGAIEETAGRWQEALEAYRRAEGAWTAHPPSDARTAGLLRAATGTAYAQRKLGHYAEAEASYRRVLTLSPTADSHFLAAQFYEDAQDSAKTREHVRRAVELAPERYRQRGEALLRKLAVYHFGCLGTD